jgi:hypothetical protein
MHQPSFAEYSDALQLDLGRALSDALLRRGTLRMRGPAHPVAHTGNFALTFEVVVDGTRHAVRCFHKPSDSLHERYDAIAACLRSISSPYFVDFEFQPSGITTESGTYPIVRMEWAEGRTLAAFVSDHRHDVGTLQSLRVSLRVLAAHLQAHGIAHGDIQPTNLIVRGPTDLSLIDYDGMFVPQLAGRSSAELGQRNFQHPGRRPCHYDANLDRFSFMLIDLALDAICRHPDLWDQTDSGADAFILRAVDFADPARSPAFRLLASVPGLEPRVTNFAASCRSPYEQVPAFEDFLAARNIPVVPIEFSGDAMQALRDRYVSIHEVVDASNFARCCTRVGDQVELIGRIVRVVMGPESPLDTDCLRVEFGAQTQDLVCLKIWPDALAGLKEIPDPTWVGRWMSAVGLVEPVHSEGSGVRRRKDVSISVTDQSQLHRLTEAEARHRLRGRRQTADVTSDSTADVLTDPVVTDAVSPPAATVTNVVSPPAATATNALSPPPAPATPLGTASRKRWRDSLQGVSRGWWWACAVMVASVLIHAGLALWTARTTDAPESGSARARATAAPAPLPTQSLRAEPASAARRLVSQQDLRPSSLPLQTTAGTLSIATADDDAQASIVLLNDTAISGLRADKVTLVQRTVYSDRDIVVGFTQCNDTAAPCNHRQPFWLELRDGAPPKLRQTPDVWASTGAGSATATDDGVQVELGVWNGERRNAVLTVGGDIVIARTPEPRRPLGRADCKTAIQSAASCATSRDCTSFASSAERIKPAQRVQLARLYHESTGLDDAAFRALCVRSCELGLTPSHGFIRRTVCAGAQPGQWSSTESVAGLIR